MDLDYPSLSGQQLGLCKSAQVIILLCLVLLDEPSPLEETQEHPDLCE